MVDVEDIVDCCHQGRLRFRSEQPLQPEDNHQGNTMKHGEVKG